MKVTSPMVDPALMRISKAQVPPDRIQIHMRREVFRHSAIDSISLISPRYRVCSVFMHTGGGGDLSPQLRRFKPTIHVGTPHLTETHTLGPGSRFIAHHLQRLNAGARLRDAHMNLVGLPFTVPAARGDL